MTRRQPPLLVIRTVRRLMVDVLLFGVIGLKSRARLTAENLFPRKQLALYLERQIKPRRADPAARFALVVLSRLIDLKQALTIVKLDTLIRWHRKGFRLFWRAKSSGRPRLPADLRRLIVRMASENSTWGEERIAAELLVKLGVSVSPTGECILRTPRWHHTSRMPRLSDPVE